LESTRFQVRRSHPLPGAGFLTGTVSTLDKSDLRQNNPRYAGPNLSGDADRFAPLVQSARYLSITPVQPAWAWLLHQGRDVIPVPETRIL
jgi:aryl-alcohol dehydrogenase-like predicted oxidoreductase